MPWAKRGGDRRLFCVGHIDPVWLWPEFTTATPVVHQGIHPGTRPQSGSLLAVDAPDVIVSAVKKCFRPFEIKTLRFNAASGQIREVNLLEE